MTKHEYPIIAKDEQETADLEQVIRRAQGLPAVTCCLP
jgi:hypothetical protein